MTSNSNPPLWTPKACVGIKTPKSTTATVGRNDVQRSTHWTVRVARSLDELRPGAEVDLGLKGSWKYTLTRYNAKRVLNHVYRSTPGEAFREGFTCYC
jgi:hypothetical protein